MWDILFNIFSKIPEIDHTSSALKANIKIVGTKFKNT